MTVSYMQTLFLHPPSYQGFDGGAGSRDQARREIRSFWYPTWLAQPAALVPGSRLIDAPPDGLTLDDVRPLARRDELAISRGSRCSQRRSDGPWRCFSSLPQSWTSTPSSSCSTWRGSSRFSSWLLSTARY